MNPYSQGGKTRHKAETFLKKLEDNNINFDSYTTHKKRHSTEIVKKHIDQYKIFIAVGGDGIFHGITQAIVNKKDKIIGIIPSGNGNMFATHHQIKNVDDTIEIIKRKKFTKMDLIKITYNTENKKRTIYSHCIFGVGYIADVVGLATQDFRTLGPKLCYPISASLGAFYSKNFKATYNIDNKKTITVNTTTPIFLNQGRVGPFEIIRDTSDKDGLLDFIIFKNLTKLKTFLCMLDTVFKTQKFNNYKIINKTKKIDVKLECEKQIMIDGEIYDKIKSFSAEVIPQALNILSP